MDVDGLIPSANSDVLKRHIEFHPQHSSRTSTLVACVSCRERKLKCDDNTPCQTCRRNGIDCIKGGPSPDTGSGDATTNTAADGHAHLDLAMTNANLVGQNAPAESPLLPDISDIDGENSPWPAGSHGHQWWLSAQQPPCDWSLSSLPSPASLNPGFSNAHILADGPNQHHPATTLTRAVDLSLPQASEGASPVQGPPGISGRSEAVSRVSSLGTGHGFSAVPSNTTRSSAPTTSPGGEPARESRGLHGLVHHDPAVLRDLVQAFFTEIHPYWPILHVPTFEIGAASDMLLGSMLMLSSWVTGRQEHLELAPIVFREVTSTIEPESAPSLHSLQALLLYVVYTVCRRSEEGMLAKAVRLNAILVSTCRCLDIFSGHHVLPDRLEECAFTLWLAKEQLHRFAFSVLRLDTYLSVLLDHPPSVRYQEMSIPLPKSSQLWMAASEEERRKLQWDEPAGREKALFSSLMRDALVDTGNKPGLYHLPYRLSAVDYHLGLCALQVGIWEAAREAHSAASDEIVTKLTPGDPIVIWRSHLSVWRTKMVRECGLGEQYLSTIPSTTTSPADPDSVLTPLTLILWHISTIKMHAPLTLLRVHGYRGLDPATAAAMAAVQKPKARMRTWMTSQCARKAVWSASQIARLVVASDGAAPGLGGNGPCSSSEPASPGTTTAVSPNASPRRLLLNPLAVPGLLMSAIVTCAYASQTSACPSCCSPHTAAVSSEAFDLFTGADEDPELVRWKEHGVGCAIWGPSGIFVCRCQLAALGGWFSSVFVRDDGAKGEFESFFEGLI
ncbi:fungal-specific transcription factor domain-containing protein [Parachaetomium inaequale]|uniref:Fungal-specific transcription factor domain-containing protein n=1 Tax=Parachaetomium inaequale TaxID=2588326 RepID=A0AAN6SM06_9PEZI|nr:fungal-specific transcription factor domain-containing protein [Parachaetomium inaequale]